MEQFALLISAAVHDFDHPGVNNSFLVKSEHELALIYNDVSVLENHHIAATFVALKDNASSTNILSNLDEAQRKRVQQLMISTVIATNMQLSFEYIGKFQTMTDETKGSADFDDPATVELVLAMAVKIADVSHPARAWEQHRQWTKRCIVEFYEQGG